MTLSATNDDTKPRLTEPVDIARAILALAQQGVEADAMLGELMRRYYVDLDAYNEVLNPYNPAAQSLKIRPFLP